MTILYLLKAALLRWYFLLYTGKCLKHFSKLDAWSGRKAKLLTRRFYCFV